MLASDTEKLDQAITLAETWRTDAGSAGIELDQIILRLPDSKIVLIWDPEIAQWRIETT